MKKLIIVFIALYSTTSMASVLEGNYLCKKGFLGFTVVDSLSIQTAKSGSMHIYMNDADFKISQDCKVLNQSDIKGACDSYKDKIVLTKVEQGYKNMTLTTTLSFEKLGDKVLVRETEKETGRGEDLTVLVCRPVE